MFIAQAADCGFFSVTAMTFSIRADHIPLEVVRYDSVTRPPIFYQGSSPTRLTGITVYSVAVRRQNFMTENCVPWPIYREISSLL